MLAMEKVSKLVDKRKNWEARVEMLIFEISKDELNTYDKLVYAILCGHANRAGNAWPRVSTLAAEASCSERQVQRALANLEAHGLLVRIPQITEKDGQIANIFEIYGIDAYIPGDCQSPGGTTDSRGAGDQQSGPIDDLEQPQDSKAPDSPPTPRGGGEGEGPFDLKPEEPKRKTKAEAETELIQGIVDAYNAMLPELPRCDGVGKTIGKHLRARIREDPARRDLDWWRRYFSLVRQGPWLMGEVSDWRANLHWLTGPENTSKVLSGAYTSRSSYGGQGGRSRACEAAQQKYTNSGGEIDVLQYLRDTGS